jgi:hypothetical protein
LSASQVVMQKALSSKSTTQCCLGYLQDVVRTQTQERRLSGHVGLTDYMISAQEGGFPCQSGLPRISPPLPIGDRAEGKGLEPLKSLRTTVFKNVTQVLVRRCRSWLNLSFLASESGVS